MFITHTCTHTRTHACLHTCMHAHACTHTCVYIHTHIHAHACMHPSLPLACTTLYIHSDLSHTHGKIHILDSVYMCDLCMLIYVGRRGEGRRQRPSCLVFLSPVRGGFLRQTSQVHLEGHFPWAFCDKGLQLDSWFIRTELL